MISKTCAACSRRLIHLLGVEAESVTSGAAALTFVAERRPGRVLLDMSMPGVDGLETLRCLRDRWADVSVVMFTAIGGERRS
jgi:CheY-like chemotaxis protein